VRSRRCARVRFRLDPKEADAPVHLPPRAPPPPQAPAAPPPPPRAAAPARWTKRRLLVAAAVALVLLAGGAGAVLYATNTGPFAYPHEYLVEGSAIPRGLKLPDVPQDIQDQWGITSNPGQVPQEHLDDVGTEETRPAEAWLEVLSAGGRSDAITVIAAKFADAQHADNFVSTARVQCLAGGSAILRDGDVVDVIVVNSQALQYYQAIVSTILGQVHGISKVCG